MSKKLGLSARINIVLDRFVEKYPMAFFPTDSMDTQPLRTGIFTLLTGDNPDISRTMVSYALRKYTSKNRYLCALVARPHRVGLDGSPFEPVSDQHRDYALRELAARQAQTIGRAA